MSDITSITYQSVYDDSLLRVVPVDALLPVCLAHRYDHESNHHAIAEYIIRIVEMLHRAAHPRVSTAASAWRSTHAYFTRSSIK